MSKYKSIILGYCKCKKCGKEKFVWNSYFICDQCHSRDYELSGIKDKDSCIVR